jgi:hypothetical protein
MKTTKARKRKRAAAGACTDLLGRPMRLIMDGARINEDMKEAARLTKSLERLLKRVRGILLRLRSKDVRVRVGKPTLRAGHLVCVPQILSRDIELVIAALRAFDLDVAHKILNRAQRPNARAHSRRATGARNENRTHARRRVQRDS